MQNAERIQLTDPGRSFRIKSVVGDGDTRVNRKCSLSCGNLSCETLEFGGDEQVGHGGISGVRVSGGRSVISQRAFADQQVAGFYLRLKPGGTAPPDKPPNSHSGESPA